MCAQGQLADEKKEEKINAKAMLAHHLCSGLGAVGTRQPFSMQDDDEERDEDDMGKDWGFLTSCWISSCKFQVPSDPKEQGLGWLGLTCCLGLSSSTIASGGGKLRNGQELSLKKGAEEEIDLNLGCFQSKPTSHFWKHLPDQAH